MLVTCFSMDRLLVSVTPRFFACKENRISVSPMRMEVGWGFGREVLFETMSRHSVLSSFSLSLFDVIHVFTSEMQSCMPWTEVSIWSGRQESCSWVSSAKDWLDMECRRMSVVRGFVYKINRIGPRTEPCGTPNLSKFEQMMFTAIPLTLATLFRHNSKHQTLQHDCDLFPASLVAVVIKGTIFPRSCLVWHVKKDQNRNQKWWFSFTMLPWYQTQFLKFVSFAADSRIGCMKQRQAS